MIEKDNSGAQETPKCECQRAVEIQTSQPAAPYKAARRLSPTPPTYVKVRQNSRIVSIAVIIAVGVNSDGRREVLASMTFPKEHRAKLRSTNPIERLNGEIKHRTEVVGNFPNEGPITRLIGAILMEQSDEWAVQRARYMTLETMGPVSDNTLVMLSAVPGA